MARGRDLEMFPDGKFRERFGSFAFGHDYADVSLESYFMDKIDKEIYAPLVSTKVEVWQYDIERVP